MYANKENIKVIINFEHQYYNNRNKTINYKIVQYRKYYKYKHEQITNQFKIRICISVLFHRKNVHKLNNITLF